MDLVKEKNVDTLSAKNGLTNLNGSQVTNPNGGGTKDFVRQHGEQ